MAAGAEEGEERVRVQRGGGVSGEGVSGGPGLARQHRGAQAGRLHRAHRRHERVEVDSGERRAQYQVSTSRHWSLSICASGSNPGAKSHDFAADYLDVQIEHARFRLKDAPVHLKTHPNFSRTKVFLKHGKHTQCSVAIVFIFAQKCRRKCLSQTGK